MEVSRYPHTILAEEDACLIRQYGLCLKTDGTFVGGLKLLPVLGAY